MRKLYAILATLTVALALAAPAMSYGPQHGPGDRAYEVCAFGEGGVVDRQTDAGIQAGGGPKSVAVAPTNCDHFWQAPVPDGAEVIGVGWPPPPFAP